MKGKVVREHLLATGDHDEWQYATEWSLKNLLCAVRLKHAPALSFRIILKLSI